VISDLFQSYPVRLICSLLGVSFSAYYAWVSKESYNQSLHKQTLAKEVKDVFEEHRSRYGAIRISKEFQARGVKIDGRPLPSSSGTNIDETARFEGYLAQKLCS
jgi:putative transposase